MQHNQRSFLAQYIRNEDWLAVWLGLGIVILALLGWLVPLNFPKWATGVEISQLGREVLARIEARGSVDGALTGQIGSLKRALEDGDRDAVALLAATLRDNPALQADPSLRESLQRLEYWALATPARLLHAKTIASLAKPLAVVLVLTGIGLVLLGGSTRPLPFFPLLALAALASLSLILAANATLAFYGLEFVLIALVLGLAAGASNRLQQWLAPVVRTEFYIKIGLVLLGSSVLFSTVVQAGALGMIQALGVVFVVWYACFWLCRRLRVDDEFAVMLSTAVSICGVSAAIAACGAIQGDRKKLSYVTSLVLLVALPMMILMPYMIRVLNIPEAVGGAWIGGTLDTTAAVVAAGSLLGPVGMQYSVIVKFAQNVLIGVAAFLLSIWWAFRESAANGNAATSRPSAKVIWERFPKFVLGFVFVSFLFSFLLAPEAASAKGSVLNGFRNLWFAMGFVAIGLETRLAELVRLEGGRPALAFVAAQGINLVWTLLLAYLLFGGILLDSPAAPVQ